MFKTALRTPFSELQHSTEMIFTTNNDIKITSGKLPADFFNQPAKRTRYSSISMVNERKKPQNLKIKNSSRQYKTSRQIRGNDNDLLMDLISSTRKAKRIIKRHSIELKNVHEPWKENFNFELPPLLVKKGISSAF